MEHLQSLNGFWTVVYIVFGVGFLFYFLLGILTLISLVMGLYTSVVEIYNKQIATKQYDIEAFVLFSVAGASVVAFLINLNPLAALVPIVGAIAAYTVYYWLIEFGIVEPFRVVVDDEDFLACEKKDLRCHMKRWRGDVNETHAYVKENFDDLVKRGVIDEELGKKFLKDPNKY